MNKLSRNEILAGEVHKVNWKFISGGTGGGLSYNQIVFCIHIDGLITVGGGGADL